MNDLLKGIFTSKDKKELERHIKEADKALDMTGDIARTCLGHESFKLYRDSYVRTEKATIDAAISFTKNFVESPGGDTTKYALTMVRLFTKLQDLRYLLNSVERDSKKGLDSKINEDEQ